MPNQYVKKGITIVELAERLNLSPRAVSQVLNGGSANSTVRVNPKTRERVEKLAKETAYRPNLAAQTFRTGKHPGLIGVLSMQSFDPVWAARSYFTHLNAEKNGLFLLQYLTRDLSEEQQQRAVDFFLDSRVEAVILLVTLSKPQILRILEQNIPVLSVGAHQPVNVPGYFADKVNGFKMLTRHLIEQGHSSITFVQSSEISPWAHGAYAEAGFLRAATDAKKEGRLIRFKIQPMIPMKIEGYMAKGYPHIHGIMAPAYAAMKQIIESGEIPSAVIGINDTQAQGVITACMEAGIHPPEEIAIAGFGDEPLSSGGMLPLTTVRQPFSEIFQAAFFDLKQTLDGKGQFPKRKVHMPCDLVVRASTLKRNP